MPTEPWKADTIRVPTAGPQASKYCC
jgi:hypothetical protein